MPTRSRSAAGRSPGSRPSTRHRRRRCARGSPRGSRPSSSCPRRWARAGRRPRRGARRSRCRARPRAPRRPCAGPGPRWRPSRVTRRIMATSPRVMRLRAASTSAPNTTRVLVADVKDGRLREVAASSGVHPPRAPSAPRSPAEKIDGGRAAWWPSRSRWPRRRGAERLRVVATAGDPRGRQPRRAPSAVHERGGSRSTCSTGDEEARLAFLGATQHARPRRCRARSRVVDVGGGSTEIAVGTLAGRRRRGRRRSPVGSGVLADALPALRPAVARRAARRARARRRRARRASTSRTADRAVAVGGSATSLRAPGRATCSTRDALAAALGAAVAARPRRGRRAATGSTPSACGCCPPGIVILGAAAAAARPPAAVGRGGLREGVCSSWPVDDRYDTLGSRRGDRTVTIGVVTDTQPERRRRRAGPRRPALFFNRELSWLEFNDRVLAARRGREHPAARAPEVLRDLVHQPRRVLHGPRRRACTTWSTRASTRRARTGSRRARRSSAIRDASCASTSSARRRCLERELRPALAEHGIRIVGVDDVERRGAARPRRALPAPDLPGAHAAGRRPRAPLPVHLQPLAVARRAACATRSPGARPFARVKVPKEMLPRFMPIGDGYTFVPLEEVIASTSTRCSRAWRSSTTTSSASRATPTSRSATRPTTCCRRSRTSCAGGASARSCASRSAPG